ncbi:MAG: methyltransferase type 11, partial [Thermodesulfobacteriota bacterium]
DVFTGRRIPDHLQNDPVLHGECLAGAMYTEDFRRLLQKLNCADHRIMSSRRIDLENPEIEDMVGMVDFFSVTVRAFKLAALEDICEDYGQMAVYLGTIPDHPHCFDLDDHHRFITGKPMLVCGNTAAMVRDTRFGKHFRVEGDQSVHYGPFGCAPAAGRDEDEGRAAGACC